MNMERAHFVVPRSLAPLEHLAPSHIGTDSFLAQRTEVDEVKSYQPSFS